MEKGGPALADYTAAFSRSDEPFLTYHYFDADKSPLAAHFTRGEFWSLARRAAGLLRSCGLGKGDCFTHYFSANRVEDLAFRLGATMVGSVPVTVNWQADTRERIEQKIELTQSRMLVADDETPAESLDALRSRFPDLRIFPVEQLEQQPELPPEQFCADDDLNEDATRIIIFTSGTTGCPKGVRLSYRSYRTNRSTFEQFLGVLEGDRFTPLVVNPLHHTNSTAITDWALRRPGSRLHLVKRYSTQYWRVLADVAGAGANRVIAPTVSRHFDYLANLHQEGKLPLGLDEFQEAMRNVEFLLGSAPVGPTTIARLQEYAGRIPHVRFGSTETCLQVLGTPVDMPENRKQQTFQRGWSHTFKGEAQCGYYIGRPHPPHNRCRIVRSITTDKPGYFVDCDEGELGYLITRGRNLMSGYVGDDEGTRQVLRPDGWYTGLKDVCFWLANIHDGQRDYYWVSRESALLNRGGANYSYQQINAELKEYVAGRLTLGGDDLDIAVVGLRIHSEHEDECCVTVELNTPSAWQRRDLIREALLGDAARHVSKGARPDHLRFAAIPRNFKGAVLVPELKEEYEAHIEADR